VRKEAKARSGARLSDAAAVLQPTRSSVVYLTTVRHVNERDRDLGERERRRRWYYSTSARKKAQDKKRERGHDAR
jgi:hypothetical protein